METGFPDSRDSLQFSLQGPAKTERIIVLKGFSLSRRWKHMCSIGLPVHLHSSFFEEGTIRPGCIPCKTHAGVTPVVPQVYAMAEGWRTPKV